jgi:nicotinamide phosphoribosyltransferase
MCAGGCENEFETYDRLISEIYPSGIVSIVSDTWDYWNTITNILPSLKEKIMSRDGKVVIRPDSGDPVKIVTGYFPKSIPMSSEKYLGMRSTISNHSKIWDEDIDCVKTIDGKYFDVVGEELTEDEVKGSIQILFEGFGGVVNDKGYIELDPHIGLIYGDSITLDRCEQICNRLERKGFASTNVVFGIGSYSYQYNTRDTFSIACKATHVVINGQPKAIFKDPKTGSGKKSAKGLLSVVSGLTGLSLLNDCTPEEEASGLLRTIFIDGEQKNKQTLTEIRGNVLSKV